MRCMMKMMVVLVLSDMCSGCDVEHPQQVQAPAKFNDEIQYIRNGLIAGGMGYPQQATVERLDGLMNSMSNLACRTAAAMAYAKMLQEVDLDYLPCRRKATSVRMYGEHVCFSFQVMMRNGVDPQDAMIVFFNCLRKYRNACTSVSDSARADGESVDDYLERKECARALKEAYVHTVSIFRRFWMPRLLEYLPTEYHEEFRRRIESFVR